MADNVTLNAGTGGDTIAADDISGVKYQIVKTAFGALDTATLTSSANPLPVVQTGTPALPTGAATAAKQPALGTAGSPSTDVITVQGATSMTALKVDGSAVTQPVSLASVPSHAVTNAGTFAVQATLAAETTKVIGTVNVASAQSIAATQSGTWSVRLQDGAGTAITSATRGATQALTVQIVDSAGTQVTSFGGTGATATDGATFTRSSSTISPIAMVETSAPTLTTGKVGALSLTTAGELRVSISSGGVTGVVEDAASAGGETGVLMMAIRQDTKASSTSTDGDFANLKVDSTGALYVTGGGGGTQYVEDVASAGGETLTLAGAIRQDTISSTTSADGDFANLKVNSVGRMYTSATIDAALPAGANTIGAVNIASAQTLATVTTVGAVTAITNALPTGANVIGALTANQSVNNSQINGVTPLMGNGVTGTGSQRVTIASDNTAFTVNVGTAAVTATGLGKAEDAPAVSGDTGVAIFAVRRDTPSSDVSAAGDYATPQVNATGSLWITSPQAAPVGGFTPAMLISAATTNATSVKASAGTLGMVVAINQTATLKYLKFYNKASAPTVGTDTPVLVFALPANSTTGAGVAVPIPASGIAFSTGIAFAITGGQATADTTAVAAGDVTLSYAYI